MFCNNTETEGRIEITDKVASSLWRELQAGEHARIVNMRLQQQRLHEFQNELDKCSTYKEDWQVQGVFAPELIYGWNLREPGIWNSPKDVKYLLQDYPEFRRPFAPKKVVVNGFGEGVLRVNGLENGRAA